MRRLLIRPGAIGDCIVSFPALESLRTDYTEIWVPKPVVPLVQFGDRVHPIGSTGLELFGIEGLDAPAELLDRLGSFDHVVTWYGSNRPEFRSALAAVCRQCTFFEALPTAAVQECATDFYARQVGAPFGLVPKISLGETEQRRSVVIHPFSGSARKNWPLPCFQSLGNALAIDVEWLAGPEEALDSAHRFDNLLEAARWIRGASLYIGNDSGTTHLAAATGVKTLALFGPTNPVVWAPRGSNVFAIKQELLSDLPVARVLEAANRLLGSS
jgi:heptosyltransferase III